MKHHIFCSIVLAVFCAATTCCDFAIAQQKPQQHKHQNHTFIGKVVSITDGDTISVMQNDRARTIRLNGIDCPEKGQAFGTKAKEFAASRCFGHDVTVNTLGQDRYHRTIAEVILPGGASLNQEMVKAGYAWWFRKFATNDKKLESLETEARTKNVGLWSDANPIAPWEYRRKKRGGADGLAL